MSGGSEQAPFDGADFALRGELPEGVVYYEHAALQREFVVYLETCLRTSELGERFTEERVILRRVHCGGRGALVQPLTPSHL